MRVRDTKKYKEIVEAINDCFFETGQSPSIREIAAAVKLPLATLRRYLVWMSEEGIIDYDEKKYRSVATATTRKAKRSGIKHIPIVGSIACGTPVLAEENIDGYVAMSTEFLGRGQYYFLRASGKSMIEAGIDNGDLVLVKQQESARNGDIVVALTGDEENTLKRYYRDDAKRLIRLSPENSAMEDIYVKECRIQGVAVKVLKDLK